MQKIEQMAKSDDDKANKRCILSGEIKPRETMIRFVPSPDGILTPDLAAKLPGRGVWVSADGVLIKSALESGQFVKGLARSLKAKASEDMLPDGLLELLIRLLTRRCMDRLGIIQRSGKLVSGFDKIKAALGKNAAPAMLFTAFDGGEDGKRKMRNAVGHDVIEISLFDREQLSLALGKDNAVHALLLKSAGLDKLKADVTRLIGLRGAMPQSSDDV